MDNWQADAIMLEKTKDADNIVKLLSHKVTSINGEKRVTGVTIESIKTNEKKDLDVQGVFIEIGLLPNSELAKGLVALNDWGEIAIDCSSHTSVDGVYAAGDVTTVPEKQISVSIGEGTKAALAAYKYLIMKS